MDLLCPPVRPQSSVTRKSPVTQKRKAEPTPKAKKRTPQSPAQHQKKRPATSLAQVQKRPSMHLPLARPLSTNLAPPIYMPLPKVVRLGSVCSGMGSEHWAMPGVPQDFEHTFIVEINQAAHKFITDNMDVKFCFKDVQSKDFLDHIPDHDVLSGGFPCQSFSMQGLNKGAEDPRGRVYLSIVEAVRKRQPRIVLLENVPGLVTNHFETFDDLLRKLRSIQDPDTKRCCYKVFAKSLNSKDFGLAQRRERIYIVAIKTCGRPLDTINMKWPQPQKPVGLDLAFDVGATTLSTYKRYPKPKTKMGRKHITQVLNKVSKWSAAGHGPATSFPIIVDIGSSQFSYGHNICPCLTRSRTSQHGYWSLQHGRPLSLSEVGRLQGFDVSRMRINVSENQMGALIGNSFSVPVWGAVYKCAKAAAEGS